MSSERPAGRGPGVAHDERRRGILDAVFTIIDTAGTEQVSIRHVAHQADVSVGRVQHYFPTKDDLLSEAFRAINDRGTSRVRDRLAGEPAEVLGALLGELIPRAAEDRRVFRIAQAFEVYAMSRPALRERLTRGYDELADLIALLLREAGCPGGPEPSTFLPEAHELLALSVGLAGLTVTGNITPEHAQHLASRRLGETLAGLSERSD
ncbi:TetR/AcrR family transcriptional regulator [Actinophytocola sediminis]